MKKKSIEIARRLIRQKILEGNHVMISVNFKDKILSNLYEFRPSDNFAVTDEISNKMEIDQAINAKVTQSKIKKDQKIEEKGNVYLFKKRSA